jgi:hypothetical protein
MVKTMTSSAKPVPVEDMPDHLQAVPADDMPTHLQAAPEDTSHDVSEWDDNTPIPDMTRPKVRATPTREEQKATAAGAQKAANAVVETAHTMASGLGRSIVGGLAGAGRAMYGMTPATFGGAGEDFDTAMDKGANVVKSVQQGAYQPESPEGKKLSQAVAAPFEMASEGWTKIGGAAGRSFGNEAAGEAIGGAVVPMVGALTLKSPVKVPSAAELGSALAKKPAISSAEALTKSPPTINITANARDQAPRPGSVGASGVDQATVRDMRAKSMDVPMALTKGMKSRDFADQRFEKETAKMPIEGQPIRERMADLRQQVIGNFDAWVDNTGAFATDRHGAGSAVKGALMTRAKSARNAISKAYKDAEESGHMAEEVPYGALQVYLEDLTPTVKDKLAPITKVVEEQIAKNDPTGKGTLPINQLEDIRKLINKNITPGTPDDVHGIAMKKLIDGSTEYAGGDLYKAARKLRAQYGAEFERQGLVKQLLASKPGTTDASVATERVVDHILKAPLDSIEQVRTSLLAGGDAGKQAWSEIQGAALRNVRDEVTKNVGRDERGTPVPSPAKLDAWVREMDKDGKLDFLFGKKGAEKIRDMNGIVKDIFVAVPDAVNTSNTATVISAMIDTIASSHFGLPLPVATVAKYAKQAHKSHKIGKQVKETLQ